MSYTFDPFTGNLDAIQQTTVVDVATKAEILALTPAEPEMAFATDTQELFLWDGSNWKISSLKLTTELQAPDMGYATDSDNQGYAALDITDKTLHNITLRGNYRPENGAIRIDTESTPNRLQAYLRDKWNTYYDDFTIENDDLRHSPLEKQIYVWRGDSVEVGLNGRSMTQEYQVSMGAFPPPKVISGGTF